MRIGTQKVVLGERGELPVLKVSMTMNDKDLQILTWHGVQLSLVYEAVGNIALVVKIGKNLLSTTKILASLFCADDDRATPVVLRL